MGVVISFPGKGRTDRRRRTWILGAGGFFALSLAAIGVALAGQDLLRGAQAGPRTEPAERASSPVPVIP
jgi:hypothetical protein